MNTMQSMTISELRQNATAAINAVIQNQQPTIILQRSKPKAVLVDINYYQALEEAVVDTLDAREADRAKTEARDVLSSYLKKRWGKQKI